MATELGQAYVQIMPSAKGISGMIQKELGAEIPSAGKGLGLSLGSSIVSAIGGVIAAAGIGKMISSAIMEGADLQQNLGGTEAVFGKFANNIQKSAGDAYKNMGMSASEYMATANKMGSLFQGSGLDQKKALDMTSEAMQRAADVASVMGLDTSMAMESIAGAAKGNFTMMDNLGVAMNATTLEAYALEKGINFKWNTASNAEKAELAMKMFMDRTSQYAGNFAKEAEETFSGSFESMKSAWKNVLGNLSLGQDITPSLNALATTVSNFLFKNLIPIVGNILKGLPGAISTFISAAAPQFMQAGKQLMSQLDLGFNSGMSGFASKMVSNLQPVMNGIMNMFNQLPGALQQVMGTLSMFGSTIANGLAQLDFSGIENFISAIIPALQRGFAQFTVIVQPALQGVVDAFVNLWNASQPLIAVISEGLGPAFQILGAFLGGVVKGALMGVQFAFESLSTVIQFLTPIVKWLVDGLIMLEPTLSVVAQWVGVAIGMFGNMGAASQGLGGFIRSSWDGIKNAVNLGKTVITNVVNAIKAGWSGLQSATNVLKGGFTAAWNVMKNAINTAKSIITGAINALKTGFNGFKSTVSTVGSSVQGVINKVASVIRGLANIDISGAGAAIMNGFLNGLKSMWGRVQSFVGGIASWVRANKGPISYDRKLLVPAGNAIMQGLNEGLRDKFSDVKSSVTGLTGLIQDSLATDLSEVNGNLDVGYNVNGNQVMMALESGMLAQSNFAKEQQDQGNYSPTLHIENFYNSTEQDAEALFKKFAWLTQREGDR